MVQAKVLGGRDEILVCFTTNKFRVVSCGHDDSQCYTDDNRVSTYPTAKGAAMSFDPRKRNNKTNPMVLCLGCSVKKVNNRRQRCQACLDKGGGGNRE